MRNVSLGLVYILVFGGIFAQSQSAPATVIKEYVELDLKGVRAFAPIKPPEAYGFRLLRRQFDKIPAYSSWAEEENLGFGARRIKLNKALGSIRAYVDLLVFRGRIAYCEIGLDVNRSHLAASEILTEWLKNGGVALRKKGDNLIFVQNFLPVWNAYKATISQSLGQRKKVDVPTELQVAYKLLSDPFTNSTISFVACDDGKPAIDKLEDAGRVDLIENVLRGHNPGGRVYAAISLLRMKRSGVRLTPSTERSIVRVVSSDADASTCRGHIVNAGLKARAIIPEYVTSDEWNLLR
jgi:hypothetical protein